MTTNLQQARVSHLAELHDRVRRFRLCLENERDRLTSRLAECVEQIQHARDLEDSLIIEAATEDDVHPAGAEFGQATTIKLPEPDQHGFYNLENGGQIRPIFYSVADTRYVARMPDGHLIADANGSTVRYTDRDQAARAIASRLAQQAAQT